MKNTKPDAVTEGLVTLRVKVLLHLGQRKVLGMKLGSW